MRETRDSSPYLHCICVWRRIRPYSRKAFKMGETLSEVSGSLDFEQELKLVQAKRFNSLLNKLRRKEERVAMKELGLQRARFYGWPNTYVLTKSMGEMILGELRGDTPLCIVRPSIITSTYKEPFPGWVEGVRTIDSVGIAFAKGKLKCFLGDYDLVLDLVSLITMSGLSPYISSQAFLKLIFLTDSGDMVVNAMIAAIYRHRNQPNEFIYHVGSSTTNPIVSTTVRDLAYNYFSVNPWTDKNGKPVIVSRPKHLPTAESFLRYIALHYQLPLKGLQLVNTVFCNYFRDTYMDANKNINFVLRCFALYKPYLFFKGVFDSSNLESLRAAVDDSEQKTYYFDPKVIDWEDYFMDIHIPGVVRYSFHR